MSWPATEPHGANAEQYDFDSSSNGDIQKQAAPLLCTALSSAEKVRNKRLHFCAPRSAQPRKQIAEHHIQKQAAPLLCTALSSNAESKLLHIAKFKIGEMPCKEHSVATQRVAPEA